MFTTVCHWILSWATRIQNTPSHASPLRSILILSDHLRLNLLSGLFLSDFQNKYMYPFLIFYMRPTCSIHLIILDLITPIIFGEECLYQKIKSIKLNVAEVWTCPISKQAGCTIRILGFDSLHHRVQNGSGAHPAPYPMGTRNFPGGKATGAWSWPLTSI
jgi:hypothetical protein